MPSQLPTSVQTEQKNDVKCSANATEVMVAAEQNSLLPKLVSTSEMLMTPNLKTVMEH